MDKKNILMISLDYPPRTYGGIGTHVYNLCKNMVGEDCKITLIVARFGNYVFDKFSEKKTKNFDVITLDSRKLNTGKIIDSCLDQKEMIWSYYNIQTFTEISKIIDNKHEKFDIIHVHHGAKLSFIAACLKRKYGGNIVTTMHAMNSQKGSYVDAVRNYALSTSDAVISVSDYMDDEISTRHPNNKPKRSYRIYNGVDIREGQAPLIENRYYDLIFCGRVTNVKGADIFKRLIEKLLPVYPNLNIAIVGDGDYLDAMREEMNYENVMFTGNVSHDEVEKYLNNSKICVIPSRIEAFGIVSLESLNSACITVASNTGGLKEIISNEQDGFLFNNENELFSITNRILKGEVGTNIIRNNAKRTLKKFSWKEISKQTLNVYSDVLSDRI